MARDCVLQDRNPDPVSARRAERLDWKKFISSARKEVFYPKRSVPPGPGLEKTVGVALPLFCPSLRAV